MNDVDDVWVLFSRSLYQVISDCVPTLEREIKLNRHEPAWFTNEARKLASKQRKLYNRSMETGNYFDRQAAAYHRRVSKKAFKRLKKQYIESRVCKPLLEGNSKPFYKHLKGSKNRVTQLGLLCQMVLSHQTQKSVLICSTVSSTSNLPNLINFPCSAMRRRKKCLMYHPRG